MSAAVSSSPSERPVANGRPDMPVRAFFRWFGLAFAGLSLVTGAWAMTNALGNAPDEGKQAMTAYTVAHGQIGALHPTVPEIYAELSDPSTLLCTHVSYNQPADCQDWVTPKSMPDRTEFTQFGTYNPLYYAIVGVPSLVLPPHAALYAMRLMSLLLFSALVAAAFALAAVAFRSRVGAAGILLALPPIVLFLGSAINPNSIEIAASVLTWTGLTALLARDLPPRTTRLVTTVVTIGILFLVLNRLLSPLWFVIMVLTVALTTRGWARLWRLVTRSRYFQVHVGVIAVAGVLAVAWTLVHPTVFVGGVQGHQPSTLLAFLGLTAQQVFFGFPQTVLPQSIAVLGWTDFAITPVVPVFAALWAGLLSATVFGMRRRAERLGPLLVAFLWIVGLSALSSYEWGNVGWQGRYGIPLAVGVPILCVELLSARVLEIPGARDALRRAMRVSAIIVIVADAFALVSNYKRYAAGWGASWDPSSWTAWQPPLGPFPWAVAALLGSVALGVLAWRLTPRSFAR